MKESYNTTCLQRHPVPRGTTVPSSLRVFTPSSLSRTQSEFISASTHLESAFDGSSLAEGGRMNDACFSVRAQAPVVLQSLFGSVSAFCVGGDLSTSLSALSILSAAYALPDAGMLSLRDVSKHVTIAAEGFSSSCRGEAGRCFSGGLVLPCLPATCISEQPDYTHLSSGVPLIRVPGHDGTRSWANAKHGTSFAEGFAFFFSVPGSLCDAGWRFLSSSAAITVTADWMRTRSYFSFSRTASAKFERFRAVAAFRSVHPSMERALRL